MAPCGRGHKHWRISDDQLLAASKSREICARVKLVSVVEPVADGISPYGVNYSGSEVVSVAAALFEVPEHHYFLAEDRAWIVVLDRCDN